MKRTTQPAAPPVVTDADVLRKIRAEYQRQFIKRIKEDKQALLLHLVIEILDFAIADQEEVTA